jgi:hypothetical protein
VVQLGDSRRMVSSERYFLEKNDSNNAFLFPAIFGNDICLVCSLLFTFDLFEREPLNDDASYWALW